MKAVVRKHFNWKNLSINIFGGSMKKAALLTIFIVFCSVCFAQAEDGKATPEDVYNLVLKAYDVVSTLGDEALPAFNDPRGEFIYKDTYAYIERCPHEMAAHPFAMEKLKGLDLDKAFAFNARLCKAGQQSGGGWEAYDWPKPGETKPSRKVAYGIKVEGTPYTIFAGIYSDTAKIENLNKTLR
jgi:cytochrome c